MRIAATGDAITTLPPIFGYIHVCDPTKVNGKTGKRVVQCS